MKKIIVISVILFICLIVAIFFLFSTNKIFTLDENCLYVAREEIMNISEALEKYKQDNGLYPTTEQGINALINKPLIYPVPLNYREGGYYQGHYLDPWGSKYQYKLINEKIYSITSFGKDKKSGGVGYSSDITKSREKTGVSP